MKLLLTSAIIEDHYQERKNEYLESIHTIDSIGLKSDVFLIETVLSKGHFIEDLSIPVFYSNTHVEHLRNKGVKEILALSNFFNSQEIVDNEMIIKLTGRYRFISDFFIREVQKQEYDLYHTNRGSQSFFGCFAIRKKYFVEFINSLNIVEMENKTINIELEFFNFIQRRDDINSKLYNKIDVYSKINNQTVVLW